MSTGITNTSLTLSDNTTNTTIGLISQNVTADFMPLLVWPIVNGTISSGALESLTKFLGLQVTTALESASNYLDQMLNGNPGAKGGKDSNNLRGSSIRKLPESPVSTKLESSQSCYTTLLTHHIYTKTLFNGGVRYSTDPSYVPSPSSVCAWVNTVGEHR